VCKVYCFHFLKFLNFALFQSLAEKLLFFQQCLFSIYFSLYTGIPSDLKIFAFYKAFAFALGLDAEPVLSVLRKIFEIDFSSEEEILGQQILKEISEVFSGIPDSAREELRIIMNQFIFAVKRRELPLICFAHLTFYYRICPVCEKRGSKN